MNLKRSDKIIAAIGIVILIIAAVFIVYYVYEEDEDDGTSDKLEENEFNIDWVEKTGEMTYTGEVGDEMLTDSFMVNTESGSILTDVTVQIMWTDDNYYGGLGGRIAALVKGLDTLTVDISLENEEPFTHEATGEGNQTFDFNIYDKPADYSIKAEDMEKAKQNLSATYDGMNSAMFNVEATVMTGESFKILKPIRSFINNRRDSGNSFDLYITYNYVYPEIEDIDNDNTEDDTNEMVETKGTQTYSSLALPGKHSIL